MPLPGISFAWYCSMKLLWTFKVTIISPLAFVKSNHKILVDFCDLSSIVVYVAPILPSKTFPTLQLANSSTLIGVEVVALFLHMGRK